MALAKDNRPGPCQVETSWVSMSLAPIGMIEHSSLRPDVSANQRCETPINLFCAKGLSVLRAMLRASRCANIGRGRGLWLQDPAALCAGLS